MQARIESEVQHVQSHVRAMFTEYVAWGGKIVGTDIQQWMYNELIDFVNFRMETADACLELIERNKIAEALGLCRSLLENYLLFMLMCRGRKYFRLEDCTQLSRGDFKKYAQEQKEELKARQEAGTTQCLAVEKYLRSPRHLMHIFEGLKSKNDEDFTVPVHYFYFKDFNPEVMRLKREDYFEYIEYSEDTQKALRGHRDNAIALHRHYLSYDALITCLELNDLADSSVIRRLEAHYTFLGKFLHPTHDAARYLQENNNYHQGQPVIGMASTYTSESRLLAALYVCYLVAGLLDEVAYLHERAPKKYITEAGTRQLRQLTGDVPQRYSYFWFLFNEPPLYDKFMYCVNHATEDEWLLIGTYANTPADRVLFNQHIYDHFKQSLAGWSNARCGTYPPPI